MEPELEAVDVPRPGTGFLTLLLAEACGWSSTVVGAGPGRVRVTLRHPIYGEVAQEGPSVADVALGVVETALARGRIGAHLRLCEELSRNGAFRC